jgi:hypothetical protein
MSQDIGDWLNNKQSQGPMPECFQNVWNLDGQVNQHSKSNVITEFEGAHTLISVLLNHGLVVYGTPEVEFCNAQAKRLCKRSLLKEDIQVFIVKSAVSFSFSTPEGMIFLSSAALARTNTKEKLAFLLAYEIARIVEESCPDFKYSISTLSYYSSLMDTDCMIKYGFRTNSVATAKVISLMARTESIWTDDPGILSASDDYWRWLYQLDHPPVYSNRKEIANYGIDLHRLDSTFLFTDSITVRLIGTEMVYHYTSKTIRRRLIQTQPSKTTHHLSGPSSLLSNQLALNCIQISIRQLLNAGRYAECLMWLDGLSERNDLDSNDLKLIKACCFLGIQRDLAMSQELNRFPKLYRNTGQLYPYYKLYEIEFSKELSAISLDFISELPESFEYAGMWNDMAKEYHQLISSRDSFSMNINYENAIRGEFTRNTSRLHGDSNGTSLRSQEYINSTIVIETHPKRFLFSINPKDQTYKVDKQLKIVSGKLGFNTKPIHVHSMSRTDSFTFLYNYNSAVFDNVHKNAYGWGGIFNSTSNIPDMMSDSLPVLFVYSWHYSSRRPFSIGLLMGGAISVVGLPFYLKWQLSKKRRSGYKIYVLNDFGDTGKLIDKKSSKNNFSRYEIKNSFFHSLSDLNR